MSHCVQDLQLGFKSNFGDINLLDDADLGIQVQVVSLTPLYQSSPLYMYLHLWSAQESSEEDVNVELRKVLELDEETSVEEPERPPAPDPASSPQLLLLSEPSPQSSPRVGRPGAARGERGHSKQPLQQQQPARPAHAAGEPDALKTSSDQRYCIMYKCVCICMYMYMYFCGVWQCVTYICIL